MLAEEEQQFRAFAREQAAGLRRTAYLMCGDWHLAEDLVQTTLIKLHRAWPRVNRKDTVQRYVRMVLTRCLLDEHRRPWRRRERRDGVVPEVLDTAADPAAAGQRAWAKNMVHQALTEVPPRQRAVLVLRYFEDLSVAEAAATLRCSEGTVKSQTSRGLTALRAAMEHQDEGLLRPAMEGIAW
ncbi:RNA polymerase sigma factor [Actinoalloteichus hymeniacidonis]|uniref:RNA polymerase sigma-70 factor, sigma-E family n=1 Tax=Actinoalloteichus hymeniacidonis TaxID=340345 RepID=A0AAC9N1B6_9PSEU|nr:SigE family RNA polymerase sigma factor [Actinoalloteichus hymeniacidonis]AOS65987.1 RNA polymerase sigma-70 factor, sigma-E family [Actinoalloteichus hymeniacidonis]MBB5905911.1 RNA polymerase sigma-70 factor (sigma-E family) [Actinoalloteichus hymeniacidonis]